MGVATEAAGNALAAIVVMLGIFPVLVEGDVQWDENVKGQDDLPDNYTYLGSEGVGVNEDGQVTRVARSPRCG